MSRPELQAPPEIVRATFFCLKTQHSSSQLQSIMVIPKLKNIPKSQHLWCLGVITKRFYLCSTRNQQIQADMTYRALELLNMPPDRPGYLLDIGCGSGLSGEILDDEGYIWTGVDIAPSMLGELCDYFSYCSSADIFNDRGCTGA